jgi:folate-binding protein YgfZ
MTAALLPDRGLVRLAGEEAATFLNGLVTSEVTSLQPGQARFAALLTPQGKIVADFLVCRTADDLLLDCPRGLAAMLAQKLGFYRLRAKVSVENVSESFDVIAVWGEGPATADLAFPDPRHPDLGQHVIVPHGTAEELFGPLADEADYEAHRIACGIAKGGADFPYGDAFPHETNMDRIGGVDFGKGCYVGQEVVSRMQHRGTARTRIVPVSVDGVAAAGAAVKAGGKPLGTMGSSRQGRGLAWLRLDRASDALAAGEPIFAGEAKLQVAAVDLAMPEKHPHA